MMDDDEFEERFRGMTTAAVGLHELFTSYMRAGFTRREAFELCKAIMSSTVASTLPPSR